jgi:hypothetical protein
MVAPGRIEAQDFPYPEVGDDAMVIALEMCGICGTDKHSYRGETTQHGGTPKAPTWVTHARTRIATTTSSQIGLSERRNRTPGIQGPGRKLQSDRGEERSTRQRPNPWR